MILGWLKTRDNPILQRGRNKFGTCVTHAREEVDLYGSCFLLWLQVVILRWKATIIGGPLALLLFERSYTFDLTNDSHWCLWWFHSEIILLSHQSPRWSTFINILLESSYFTVIFPDLILWQTTIIKQYLILRSLDYELWDYWVTICGWPQRVLL